MNKLDIRMSELMEWKIHEGMYRIFDRYFVKKDKKNITGYSTDGINQDYDWWEPSKNIKQAIRIAEKVFYKYTIEKNESGYMCIGHIKKQRFYGQPPSFRGKSKKLATSICNAARKI